MDVSLGWVAWAFVVGLMLGVVICGAFLFWTDTKIEDL